MNRTLRFILGIAAFFTFLVLALFPWEQYLDAGVNLRTMMALPSFEHPLGTDNLGRDLVVRMSLALRQAVLPVWFVTLVATLLGYGFGGILALATPAAGVLFRQLAGVVVAVPIGLLVFFAATISEVIGVGAVLIPMGIVFFLRGTCSVLDMFLLDCLSGYWQANRAIGGTTGYRLLKYGFGQSWCSRLTGLLGFHLKVGIVAEVSLSYLGFGIQEPSASFGNMLAAHFDSYLNGSYWVLGVVVAGFWLVTTLPSLLLANGSNPDLVALPASHRLHM